MQAPKNIKRLEEREKPHKTVIIGLTGSYGTGKSTVAGMLAQAGAVVIDADKIAHQIMRPRTKASSLIASHFGNKILKKGGQIDRKLLAEIVFAPGAEQALDKLCRIIHPPVIKKIDQEIRRFQSKGYKTVVIDAPLLLETGLEKKVDKVVVVKAARKKQIERCRKAYHLSEKQILGRIRAQMPLKEKLKKGDFIINNNSSFSNTKSQVKQFLASILFNV